MVLSSSLLFMLNLHCHTSVTNIIPSLLLFLSVALFSDSYSGTLPSKSSASGIAASWNNSHSGECFYALNVAAAMSQTRHPWHSRQSAGWIARPPLRG